MNTIDQRILIPASPEEVWSYISDINKNPEWQQGCNRVALLTSNYKGQGARWRCSTSGRRDTVIEITAWYERLGYEYRIVDGAPYKENIGRIRLQDTPEGTIVQWTFHYDFAGIIGGIRNTLSTRRTIENMIVESLWSLWRNISQAKDQMKTAPYTAKSLMQDAPDVEARAHYIPRHPSTLKEPDSRPISIPEPPLAEEDTRPRPEISTSTGEAIRVHVTEPDFLHGVYEEHPVTSTPEPSISIEDEIEAIKNADTGQDFSTTSTDSVPERPQLTSPVDADLVHAALEAKTPVISPASPINSITDTGSVSVFELFGLPKPSETQELSATVAPLSARHVSLSGFSRRVGMRIMLRRKRLKIRRPE